MAVYLRKIIAPSCYYFLSLLLFGAFGCTDNQSGKKPPIGETFSEQECRNIAESIEYAVESHNSDIFSGMFDWDEIIRRATTPSEGSKKYNQMFVKFKKRNLSGENGFASRIIGHVKQGGEFKYLRNRTKEGTKWLLFRLWIPERSSLDYFDFELDKLADGTFRISDYYRYRNGWTQSESLRRGYLRNADAGSRVLEKNDLSEEEMSFAENNKKIEQMNEFCSAGNGQRALDIYAELPAALQKEKSVLLCRLEAASYLGGAIYDDATIAARDALPNDPCLDFALVNYYYTHNEGDKYRAAIDRIDKKIDGDAYLDALRAIGYFQEKNYKLAREFAQKAIDVEDKSLVAYIILLQTALAEKDFDEVSKLITIMEEKSIMTFPDLTTEPIFADYMKSPQYEKLLNEIKE
jgi:hypothetical protein